MHILNSTRMVLLAVWFGAAVFFSLVVAPAAFAVLRLYGLPNTSEIAGAIVSRSLSVVNVAGFVIALLLAVTIFARRDSVSRKGFLAEGICLAVIALTTALGHWFIAARMRALRATMILPIDQLTPDDARRVAFNSLHGYSVIVLSLAMIAALVALVLMARSARQ
ncbi:MAG TPA: DUF4149 domain-containing protein [Pyrinomonadaceae bacterium]|nr:DUF4149 domain-containing protein [Pyrinomonadaceae bacterium]